MSQETPNIFLPYQKRWLNDRSQIKFAEKSRQIGWTWMSAFEDVLDCSVRESVPRAYLTSKDFTTTELYIDYCKFHAKGLSIVAEDLGTILIDIEKNITARTVRFNNGSTINAVSSSTGALRGKSGKITLDEFAWHKDPNDMWDAAQPATTWGYPLRVFSSHNGISSLFYKQLQEAKSENQNSFKASTHCVTIIDAVYDGMLDKILKRETSREEQHEWIQQQLNKARGKKNMPYVAKDGHTFFASIAGKQEYLCEAVDEATALFTYDLISSCERDDILATTLDNIQGEIYWGVDIARKKNLTVIWGVELSHPLKITRHIIPLEKTKFSEQKAQLRRVLKHPKTRRMCIDSSGIGMQLAEEMIDEFGKLKVEDVTFTNPMKAKLVTEIESSMQDQCFLIPGNMDDAVVREDFHSIQKEITAAGHTRYVPETNEENPDSHADYFWAAALANYACGGDKGEPELMSFGTHEAREINRKM